MSIETGVLVSLSGEPLYWHSPNNRTVVSLPDSRDLWNIFWENRKNISGFAHSHPGSGVPGPSYEDVTTFSAIELALGMKLDWWITSKDEVVLLRWGGTHRYKYPVEQVDGAKLLWLNELRRLSYEDKV